MLEDYLRVSRAEPNGASRSERTIVAEEAIVLSRLPGQSVLLTHHTIGPGQHGTRRLREGKPIDREQAMSLLARIAVGGDSSFLPENVVARNTLGLAWWCASRRAPQFWKLPSGTVRLNVPWPALYFVAGFGDGLRVFALTEDARPTAKTPLYHAPIGNVYEDGGLCWGNVRRPELALSSLPDFESAIYRSNFTHSNFAGNFRDGSPKAPEGLLSLWQRLHDRKATVFPVEQLVPANLTASSALQPG